MLTLEKPFQRAAPGASIQPNDNFIGCVRICRREEPKEKLGGILRI